MPRPKSKDTLRYEEKLSALNIDDSFFVPNVKQADLAFLRRISKGIGIVIEMHYTDSDEIYAGQSGVRVWRRAP